MRGAISFAAAQERWDNMLPPDDSRAEAAFERACEEIESDPERLLEAAIDGGDEDDSVRLAELQIMLRNVSNVLGRIACGDDLDDVLRNGDRAIAFRALLRAAADADTRVAKCLQTAAEEALS